MPGCVYAYWIGLAASLVIGFLTALVIYYRNQAKQFCQALGETKQQNSYMLAGVCGIGAFLICSLLTLCICTPKAAGPEPPTFMFAF